MATEAETAFSEVPILPGELMALYELRGLSEQINANRGAGDVPKLTLHVEQGEVINFPAFLLAGLQPLLAALSEGKCVTFAPDENAPISAVAELLGVSTSEIEALIAEQKLTAVDPPTEILIPLEEVYDLMQGAEESGHETA